MALCFICLLINSQNTLFRNIALVADIQNSISQEQNKIIRQNKLCLDQKSTSFQISYILHLKNEIPHPS